MSSFIKPVVAMEINANERVILQVNSQEYIRLEFPGITVALRYEDGVIYQYQEKNDRDKKMEVEEEEEEIEEFEVASDDVSFKTPDRVVKAAGGHFSTVNRKHEEELTRTVTTRKHKYSQAKPYDLMAWECEELAFHYGDTP